MKPQNKIKTFGAFRCLPCSETKFLLRGIRSLGSRLFGAFGCIRSLGSRLFGAFGCIRSLGSHGAFGCIRSLGSHLREGQTMLLTVLTIGGTLLAVSLVAGLLITFQIRQAGGLADTSKALFAADAGVEWYLYHQGTVPVPPPDYTFNSETGDAANGFDAVPFSNGAKFEVIAKSANEAKVIGQAGNSKRAFLIITTPGGIVCADNSDVMLVLQDSPLAVNRRDLYKNAVKNFRDQLFVSSPDIYVGQVTFEGGNLDSALNRTSHPLGFGFNFNSASRNLGAAIALARDELDAPSAGDPFYPAARNPSETPNFIVIVSEDQPNQPVNASNFAKSEALATWPSARIIVVGIEPTGVWANILENNIASSPSDYFSINDYADLEDALINDVLPLIYCS